MNASQISRQGQEHEMNDMSSNKSASDSTIKFIIRVPNCSSLKSISNLIIKKISYPFKLLSIADEFHEKSKYEDSLSEISDRKRKNDEVMKKYKEAHETWESDKETAMYGYENLPQYTKDRALKEFLQQEPEPIMPELVSEKIRKTISEKTARLFTICYNDGMLNYGMKYIEKAHVEIAKFVFEILPVLFKKERIADNLISFSIIGETLDYKVSSSDYTLDHSKIESFARLRKIIQDLKQVIKQTKVTMNDQKVEIKRLEKDLAMEQGKSISLQSYNEEADKEYKYFKKLVFLGLDKADYAKALQKMRSCLEVEGKTEEEINDFIEETKKHIGRDI